MFDSLQHCLSPTTESFTNSPSKIIKLCVDRATDGGITPFSRLIQTPLATFYGWYQGRREKPRLKDVLKICHCLNLTLLDFFIQPEICKTKEIKTREWIGIAKNPPRPTPRTFDRKRLKSKLKKYITMHPPLSLAEISREIGCDKAVLRRAFPDIRYQIKSNYNKYQKLICETRRNELEQEIKSAVYALEEIGEYVSTKRVAIFLNKPSYEGRRDVAQIVFNTRKIGKPLKNQNK